MEKAIADTGDRNNVDLRSRETPMEIARWMNAADLLCLTSHNEGFPNVILEAMASGLKVVSTDVGGIHELVTHSGRGSLVAAGDLDAYVGALEEALGCVDFPREDVCDPDWSWENTAKDYGSVIKSAIGAS